MHDHFDWVRGVDRVRGRVRDRWPRAYAAARDARRRRAYRGATFGCTVCGRTFGRWEAPTRRSLWSAWPQICPYCNSHPRQRMLWRWLPETTDLFRAHHRLLHLAPEASIRPLLAALPNIDYVTGDLFTAADVRLDIARLPFPDCAFDVVFCNHVFECVPDDIAAMREVARVMRRDGWAVLLVPYHGTPETIEGSVDMDTAERIVTFGSWDSVRGYGDDYAARLDSAGFDVRMDCYTERLDPRVVTFYGMQPEMMVLATKR